MIVILVVWKRRNLQVNMHKIDNKKKQTIVIKEGGGEAEDKICTKLSESFKVWRRSVKDAKSALRKLCLILKRVWLVQPKGSRWIASTIYSSTVTVMKWLSCQNSGTP